MTRRIGPSMVVVMLHPRKLEELMVLISGHDEVIELGLTKLWKLVFFIDQEALREFGQTITGSDYIKYEHGPVPSRGEKHLKKLCREKTVVCQQRAHGRFRLNEVQPQREAEPAIFSREEWALANQVCQRLGRKSARELSELSHTDPAWHYGAMLQKLSPSLMAYGTSEDAEGL